MFLPSPPLYGSMVPLTSISTSSKPTLCHIQGFTSPWFLMPRLSPLPERPMKPTRFRKFPTHASSPTIRWSNVILETESTWQLVFCTGVTLSPKRYTPLLPLSRPRRLSSLSTGAQPASRLVSASSHHNWCPTEIWPKSTELCMYPALLIFRHIFADSILAACYPTPPLLPRPGTLSATSSISCILSALSFTGMLVKVWRKVNFRRQERTWLLLVSWTPGLNDVVNTDD